MCAERNHTTPTSSSLVKDIVYELMTLRLLYTHKIYLIDEKVLL